MTPEDKKAKRNAYLAAWREKNRDKTRAAQQRYYEANKAVCDERVKACHSQNRSRYSAKAAEWRQANKTHVLAVRRKQYASNPGPEILRVRLRQRRIRTAPAWLTPADIAEINGLYRFCNIFKGFEVDHIIPLNGKQVSGLHVPSNLQVLTVRANRQKGAAFEGAVNGR
jgi:hypothetical protein